MSYTIDLDRTRLVYEDGDHRLTLPVEWSFAPKTADSPADLEILAEGVTTWSAPAGERIAPAAWEQILDRIAARFATGPQADIIGKDGALLRGVSKYKFYLGVHPVPSRYYEPGRSLIIPMVQTDKTARPRLVLDVSHLTSWTTPKEPLPAAKLHEIVARITRDHPHVGVLG